MSAQADISGWDILGLGADEMDDFTIAGHGLPNEVLEVPEFQGGIAPVHDDILRLDQAVWGRLAGRTWPPVARRRTAPLAGR
jgi:hypothetical protein